MIHKRDHDFHVSPVPCVCSEQNQLDVPRDIAYAVSLDGVPLSMQSSSARASRCLVLFHWARAAAAAGGARASRCASAVDFAGDRPSARGQLEWIVASPEALAESGSKGGLEVLIERLAERAGRANTGGQRRP
jgi:hypothetical protein